MREARQVAKSTVTLTGTDGLARSFPVSQAAHPLGSRKSHGLKTPQTRKQLLDFTHPAQAQPLHLTCTSVSPFLNTGRSLPGLGKGVSDEERPWVLEGDLTTPGGGCLWFGPGKEGVGMRNANAGNDLRRRTSS